MQADRGKIFLVCRTYDVFHYEIRSLSVSFSIPRIMMRNQRVQLKTACSSINMNCAKKLTDPRCVMSFENQKGESLELHL